MYVQENKGEIEGEGDELQHRVKYLEIPIHFEKSNFGYLLGHPHPKITLRPRPPALWTLIEKKNYFKNYSHILEEVRTLPLCLLCERLKVVRFGGQ